MAKASRQVPWKQERLRKRKEFLRVYEQGDKVRVSLFFLYFLRNNLSHSRLGITVSRKVGKPVIRNRLKRRLREIFKDNREGIRPPCDVVINTRYAAGAAPYGELEADFERGLEIWSEQARQ